MHRVDTQISGTAFRPRFAPLPDRDRRRPRRLIAGIAFAIALGVAKPVDWRHRDLRQACEGCLTILVVLAFQDSLRRRTARVAMTSVHVSQQFHVRFCVTGGKLAALIPSRFYAPA